jgi:hypothetical protein
MAPNPERAPIKRVLLYADIGRVKPGKLCSDTATLKPVSYNKNSVAVIELEYSGF